MAVVLSASVNGRGGRVWVVVRVCVWVGGCQNDFTVVPKVRRSVDELS